MTLENLTDLFDDHLIVDQQEALNTEYIASSDNIFSDGHFDHRMRSDGYITIYNVSDANYIIYIDDDGDLFIAIYKYIDDMKFKTIVAHVNEIRALTGMHKHNATPHHDKFEVIGDVYDINTMTCLDCGSNLRFTRIKNSDTIVAFCSKCNIEYALLPSKYYILKAVKHLYINNSNARNLKLFKEDHNAN